MTGNEKENRLRQNLKTCGIERKKENQQTIPAEKIGKANNYVMNVGGQLKHADRNIKWK